VAAGHGFYGIELAMAFPEAVVTAVDWPSVLELASANARDAGVAERYQVVPGNAFEVDWGGESISFKFVKLYDRVRVVAWCRRQHQKSKYDVRRRL
jgi:precorrin-6B methylase 2